MRITRSSLLVAAVAVATLAGQAIAGTTVVDVHRGPDDDAFAAGSIVNSSGGLAPSAVSNWILNATVSETDFDNFEALGGEQGVQYTMMNNVMASSHSNRIQFATTLPNAESSITISQSPYWNAPGTWNGGNVETSRMDISWNGGGVATVFDPDDQLLGYTSESEFGSGARVAFNGFVYNDEDTWVIELPQGISSVTIDWSSTVPTANSDLTKEWVTFDVTSTVPEPGCLGMAVLALSFLGWTRRR